MIHEIKNEEDFESFRSLNGPRVLLYHAPAWCAPCRAFHPHFEKVSENLPDVHFAQVNIDTSEYSNPEEFHIQSVPAVFFLADGGNIPLKERTGPKFQAELLSLIN